FILPDMNGDGTRVIASPAQPANATPDDRNYDGTLDFDNWLGNPPGTPTPPIDDPWLRFMSEGDVLSGGNPIEIPPPGCNTNDCQPAPFYNSSSNELGDTADGPHDHSNIFKNVSRSLCPVYDYSFWKNVALAGGENVYYYQS